MNNINHEEDPRLHDLYEFIDKYKSINNGDASGILGHNIYLLKTVDRDGNITGEAFAKNVLCEAYFTQTFGTASGDNYNRVSYLFIGDGQYEPGEEPLTTDTTLKAATYRSAATGNGNDYNAPTKCENATVYWDATNEVQYSDSFVLSVYFDYNLSGITTDLNITEIGISAVNNISNLATKSLVYDTNGQPTTFVKHPNEKLFISAYVRVYYKPGYIENKMYNDRISKIM